MVIQTEKVKTLSGIMFSLYADLPYNERRTYNVLLQKRELLRCDLLTPQI